MKQTIFHTLAALCLMLPTTCMAQQENPRGVYKLTGLIDKRGDLIKEPFDQYKICTDSVTLMFTVQGSQYGLSRNDRDVFNYTGEAPDAKDEKATRIYDSNAQHFTQKWWSTMQGHILFPENGWCTEYYESGKYSETAKQILDAMMSVPASDPKNPLIGAWRFTGMMDELRDTKKELKRLQEATRNMRHNGYLILTPSHAVMHGNAGRGSVNSLSFPDKKSIKIGNTTMRVIWLTSDCFAMEVHPEGYRTDYEIWQRVTGSTPVLNKIASQFVIH